MGCVCVCLKPACLNTRVMSAAMRQCLVLMRWAARAPVCLCLLISVQLWLWGLEKGICIGCGSVLAFPERGSVFSWGLGSTFQLPFWELGGCFIIFNASSKIYPCILKYLNRLGEKKKKRKYREGKPPLFLTPFLSNSPPINSNAPWNDIYCLAVCASR